ncbi:MAG: Ig-like domain-containing protein [Desulfuromonadaceae bacterium]|nr:Ig-like domain-containing protein [Desulfuromonadaceae bacterium]
MGTHNGRYLGQILLDGGFLSKADLNRAMEEQKRTGELLGQVLVRMGVLKQEEISAPLSIQGHLSTVAGAVRIAAGERLPLGTLLVRSKQISAAQLNAAITEQKRTGEKLGDVLIRLGMLAEQQLAALLELQHIQEETTTASPLRLGELLVATGDISRAQLDDSLCKQSLSHKKLGEVLVEEGYIKSNRIKKGFRLQRMLINAALSALLSLSFVTPGIASTVLLQWDANQEPDLAGYNVYYSADPSPLQDAFPINVNNQTTTTVSNIDPAKTYRFAVTSYNTAGVESGFSNIATIYEQVPPTVSITSPADAGSVSGIVPIAVDATDNVGVVKVEFFVNGVLTGSEIESPYVYLWDTHSVPGTYTLMVKAYDEAGNVSVPSSRTVTVVTDDIAPTVGLTSPVANSVHKGTVAITATAADNVAVTKVEYFVVYPDSTSHQLPYSGNVSPYSCLWDTTSLPNGNYAIIAKAYDAAGNIAQSSQVSITVDNAAPIVSSFSVPATSTSLTVAVSGFSASDNRGVTGYMLTESAVPPTAGSAGWSATAPTSYTFSSEGTKTLYAWAKDSVGNVSASRSASVTVTLPSGANMSLADALLALQIGLGTAQATPAQLTHLDVAPVINGVSVPDGKVGTGDAIVILTKVVGKSAL